MKPYSSRGLDVHQVTLELITSCATCCDRLKRFNRRLGDQLIESLASTLQNLTEGLRRTGKDRAHLLGVALGSCDEARSLLDAAVAYRQLSREEQLRLDGLADRVCAMIYRLRQRAV